MDKNSAKKYLASLIALYVIGGLFIFVFTAALSKGSELSLGAVALIALLLPLFPAGSFSGFCNFFWERELPKTQTVLMIIFFPLFLAFITLFGIIMIIPSVIKSIKIIRG